MTPNASRPSPMTSVMYSRRTAATDSAEMSVSRLTVPNPSTVAPIRRRPGRPGRASGSAPGAVGSSLGTPRSVMYMPPALAARSGGHAAFAHHHGRSGCGATGPDPPADQYPSGVRADVADEVGNR